MLTYFGLRLKRWALAEVSALLSAILLKEGKLILQVAASVLLDFSRSRLSLSSPWRTSKCAH